MNALQEELARTLSNARLASPRQRHLVREMRNARRGVRRDETSVTSSRWWGRLLRRRPVGDTSPTVTARQLKGTGWSPSSSRRLSASSRAASGARARHSAPCRPYRFTCPPGPQRRSSTGAGLSQRGSVPSGSCMGSSFVDWTPAAPAHYSTSPSAWRNVRLELLPRSRTRCLHP